MKTYIGIDLGSTTTKSVLLDENQSVIGRGITNSRSNYATAARVASEEARIDARFTLLRRSLGAGEGEAGADDFLASLERAFRLEQFLEQLGDLHSGSDVDFRRQNAEGRKLARSLQRQRRRSRGLSAVIVLPAPVDRQECKRQCGHGEQQHGTQN